MLPTNLPLHHSADVHLSLITAHGTVRLAQIGPQFVIVAKPVDMPPGDAEILMRVDGYEKRWPIHLTEGLSAHERKAAIVQRG